MVGPSILVGGWYLSIFTTTRRTSCALTLGRSKFLQRKDLSPRQVNATLCGAFWWHGPVFLWARDGALFLEKWWVSSSISSVFLRLVDFNPKDNRNQQLMEDGCNQFFCRSKFCGRSKSRKVFLNRFDTIWPCGYGLSASRAPSFPWMVAYILVRPKGYNGSPPRHTWTYNY